MLNEHLEEVNLMSSKTPNITKQIAQTDQECLDNVGPICCFERTLIRVFGT